MSIAEGEDDNRRKSSRGCWAAACSVALESRRSKIASTSVTLDIGSCKSNNVSMERGLLKRWVLLTPVTVDGSLAKLVGGAVVGHSGEESDNLANSGAL